MVYHTANNQVNKKEYYLYPENLPHASSESLTPSNSNVTNPLTTITITSLLFLAFS